MFNLFFAGFLKLAILSNMQIESDIRIIKSFPLVDREKWFERFKVLVLFLLHTCGYFRQVTILFHFLEDPSCRLRIIALYRQFGSRSDTRIFPSAVVSEECDRAHRAERGKPNLLGSTEKRRASVVTLQRGQGRLFISPIKLHERCLLPPPRFRISGDPFKILRRDGRKGLKWNFRFSAAKPTDEIETLGERFARLDGQLRIFHRYIKRNMKVNKKLH